MYFNPTKSKYFLISNHLLRKEEIRSANLHIDRCHLEASLSLTVLLYFIFT